MTNAPQTSPLPDLLSKAAVPLILGLCAAYFTGTQDAFHRHEECATRTQASFAKVCPDGDCRLPDGDKTAELQKRGAILRSEAALLSAFCGGGDGGKDYGQLLWDLVFKDNPEVAKRAALVTGETAPKAVVEQEKVQPQPTPIPPVVGAFNIYVQYHLATQKDDVLAVMRKLRTSKVGDRQVTALGPEQVGSAQIQTTQIRCFDVESCKSAQVVATFVGGLIGQTVLPRDFSNTYENKSGKELPLELWFSDQPIRLKQEG